MYCQRDPKWANVVMGAGKDKANTIGLYGCYLTSLCQGLFDRDWNYNVLTLNNLLTSKGVFGVGPYKNFIDVANLSIKIPEIFQKFLSVDPYSHANQNVLQGYLNKDYVVIGRVDAKYIGGSGDHFVYIVGFGPNGKLVIGDPWTGDSIFLEDKYKTLLGLRVFKVNSFKEEEPAMKIDANQDIPTEIEDGLQLKSYSWYDKRWTWGDMFKEFNRVFLQEEKLELDNTEKEKAIFELTKEIDITHHTLAETDRQRAEMSSIASERLKQVNRLTDEKKSLQTNLDALQSQYDTLSQTYVSLKKELESVMAGASITQVFNFFIKVLISKLQRK